MSGLRTEQVIPRSLGGDLELHRSICKACAEITAGLERSVSRQMFGRMKLALDRPVRERPGRASEHALQVHIDGQEQAILLTESLPLASAPALPVFRVPGILRGVPPSEGLTFSLERARAAADSIVPIGSFARMLAKIAHASAVHQFGLGAFDALLPEIITGKSSYPSYLVGGVGRLAEPDRPNDMPRFEDGTHRVVFETAAVQSTTTFADQSMAIHEYKYLCATLQLFRPVHNPLYLVVVGIPSDLLAQQLDQLQQVHRMQESEADEGLDEPIVASFEEAASSAAVR